MIALWISALSGVVVVLNLWMMRSQERRNELEALNRRRTHE